MKKVDVMKNNKKVLVTGANGHLGNNLVKELLQQGYDVRASIRDMRHKQLFEGLSCQVVYADMLKKESLMKAFANLDVLFHLAAVFKHWSKNQEEDILQANLTGTRNVLEAAFETGVKKIIYVSSIAALDYSQPEMNEQHWGTAFPNVYFKSKNETEKLAWKLAERYGVNMISVLPSGIIGPDISSHLTPSMNLMNNILHNKLPFDPQYEINYVHVKDVAAGMVLAEQKGRVGERYILGNENSMNSTDVIRLAQEVDPSVKTPRKQGKLFQLSLAVMMGVFSHFTGKPPLLLAGNINYYYKKKKNLNIRKARIELGYKPRTPEMAVKETLEFLNTGYAGDKSLQMNGQLLK